MLTRAERCGRGKGGWIIDGGYCGVGWIDEAFLGSLSFMEAWGVPHLTTVPTPSCALTSWAPEYPVRLRPSEILARRQSGWRFFSGI